MVNVSHESKDDSVSKWDHENNESRPADRADPSSKSLQVGLVIVFAIVAFVVFNFWVSYSQQQENSPPAGFEYTIQDPQISSTVWFVSTQEEITTFTNAWRASQKTIIVLSLVERGGANSGMASALTLFQTVFRTVSLIPDQNIVTLAQLYSDDQKTLISCQTDLGSKQTITLTPQECVTLLEPNDQFVISIPFPDSSLKTNLVEFKDNFVIIRSKSITEIGSTSYAFVQGLYPESKNVLSAINDRIDVINGR